MGTGVLHGDIEVNLGRVYKNMQETWSADSLIPGLTQTHSLHLPHLYTSVPLVNYNYGIPTHSKAINHWNQSKSLPANSV